jgi:protocatechuate 3,4-dioxygenase beta subunit
MSLKRTFYLIVLLLLAVVSAGFASRRTRNPEALRMLSGTVTDQYAQPIADAAVQIENEKTLLVRSYITDAQGQFHFAELSPDADYNLQAVFDGIRGRKKTLSQFDSRSNPTVKLEVRLPHMN